MSAPYYCLQVKRLENLQWKRPFHTRTPNLYVEVKLGADVKTTRAIKKSSAPVWSEELTFSPSDGIDIFNIKVLHDSKLLPESCVGEADIPIADLLAASTSGEARFDLYRRNATERSGTIVMHLKPVDTMSVSIMIDKARDDVRESGIARPEQLPPPIYENDDRITRSSSGSKLYQAFEQLLPKLSALIKVIDAVSEAQSYLAIACKLTSALLKAVKHVFDIDKKLVMLVSTMKDAYDFSYDTLSLPEKAARLEKSISGLVKQTIECCLFIGQYTKGNFIGRMLDTSSSDKIDEFEKSLTRYRNAIESGVSLQTAFASVRILDGIDEILLRQRLEPSQTDTSNRPRSVCLEGTRMDILMEISDWIFSENEKTIFWLHGVAGSGKSTISTTIAERFRDMLVLGGSLVFERGKSDPSSVIRTIAYKLALHDSRIASEIATVTKEDKDIAGAIPATQFEKLLLRPLAAVADSLPGPVAFVLDALDECGTTESRRGLLQLFRHNFAKLPKKFRFLITSRPEKDIDYALAFQNKTVRVMELDYTSTSSQEDVLSYLRTEIETIVTEQVGPEAAEDWDWEESAVVLGKAASGLFIFASTAVKMISASDNPFRTLKKLVSNTSSVAHFGLDELYATVLRQSGIVWDDEESKSRFANVLALVLLSKIPLSRGTVDDILGFSPLESSLLVLSRLRCLLSYSPGGPVSLFHASFHDYLTSPERAKDSWYIDIPAQQYFIASRCFSVMRDTLRFNMYSLESSFVSNEDVPGLAERVQRSIPAHLQYACLYWSSHLCKSPYSPGLIDMLSEFAHERLLFWFEALSLMAAFGRFANPALADATVWTHSHDADLSSFLKDASRLALVFGLPIVQSTPHIYTTMIPLAKDESIVSSHYSKKMSNLVHMERRGNKQQSACLKVLEGHSHSVMSVAVSPNGTVIASGSTDETVRVWHITSGEEVVTMGHSSAVGTLCFSPDGCRLASGCVDGAVRVWDILEKKLVLGPLKQYTGQVNSVAYSPDGRRIASGSSDGTIIVWDALSGVIVSGPFLWHSARVWSVAFAADGSRVVSGSQEKTIIWDVASGRLVLEPFIHPEQAYSVAFCPTSKCIACSCWDGNVRIWDMENGIPDSVLSCESSSSCVAYSPCGTRTVAGSDDGTVAVWDANSGHVISILKGHSGRVESVGFTPDGKYVVSGSGDRTVRVWDVDIQVCHNTEAVRHTSVVTCVAFSPCGRWIASASNDMTIIIWNARTGEAVMGPLRGHSNYVNSVLFSSDGSQLASASDDGTIRLWNVDSGKPIAELAAPLAHKTWVNCIALSPDGAHIVSGSADATIWIWHIAHHNLVAGPLLGHTDSISSVAFSSDNTRLASGSVDNAIRIWDTKTWETTLEPLRGHEDAVLSVCFSPDSTRIASSSRDRAILVWSAETGQIIAGPFEEDNLRVHSVIFLPDGSHLVAGYYNGTIRLWSIATGQAVGDTLHGHSKRVASLALSPDGTRFASGSWDKTIRVWDVSAILRPAQKCSSTARAKAKARASSISASSDQEEDTPNWVMEKDGWILGGPDRRDLLCWIPHDFRKTLWSPQNTAVCWDFSTKLDFNAAAAAAALGCRWTECFAAQ